MAEYQILIEENTLRLDQYITKALDNISRSKVQTLIKSGYVTLLPDKIKVNSARMTKIGEKYNVVIPAKEPLPNFSESINIDVVYEDDDLLVINKPPGLVVHGGIGTKNDTLVDLLLKCYSHHNLSSNIKRPGIVHRLDKDTSGLMVIAKSDIVHAYLAQEIVKRTLKRQYITITLGTLPIKNGSISAQISTYPKDRRRMHIVQSGGKIAITHYKVLGTISNDYSIVECSLETGRTHQIRVHMRHIGNPIVGDTTYGKSSDLISRQALHAHQLTLIHPKTTQIMSFKSKIPQDMEIFFDQKINELIT